MKHEYFHFLELRKKYPLFEYQGFEYQWFTNEQLAIQFHYYIHPDIFFAPKTIIFFGKNAVSNKKSDIIENLIFNIGMVEMLSYWKTVCSPQIKLPKLFSEEQQTWWKKLFYKGLGEFFFKNGIALISPDFAKKHYEPEHFPKEVQQSDSVIVPIGGGKDSVVTLEALKKGKKVVPLIINPRKATLNCAAVAGFPQKENMIIIERKIDSKLLELNDLGFLNGHTPFSAMLAFYSVLTAYLTGIWQIALSNESSANEPTIPNTDINHQYSKSEEFEKDFRWYVKHYLNNAAFYYSYLRPYNEWQIAEKFAQHSQYFSVFRSCNVGSKEDKWCCHCPKCLFTAIILAPFVGKENIRKIFGEDILNKAELVNYLEELSGFSVQKPFECVGTIGEVNRALTAIQNDFTGQYLVDYYKKMKLEK
jgi:hypothetical protein